MLLSHKGKYLKQLHFKIKNNLKQSVTKANSLSTFLSENWLLSLPLCRLIPGQFSALLIHPNAVSTICIGTICWGFYTCQFLHAEDLSPQCQSRYFCQEILRGGYLHWNVLTFSELNILFWLFFFSSHHFYWHMQRLLWDLWIMISLWKKHPTQVFQTS